MALDHRLEPDIGLLRNEIRDSNDEVTGLGPDHQYRLGPRPRREPQKLAYVAAKHGVVGATKVAALELTNAGVTVNAICPGWVLTSLGREPDRGKPGQERRHRRRARV